MDAAPLIDPRSTFLQIGGSGIVPTGQDGWRATGERIGSHRNLRRLYFCDVDTTGENLEALLAGVNQNRTVRELQFSNCRGRWPLGIFAMFFQNNQNLSVLGIHSCSRGIISSLSAALRGCASRSLERISCYPFQVGDEALSDFVVALDGLPQLKKLGIYECNIGRRGCGVVAALLRSPACMLQEIDLSDNGFSDESLAVLGPAVAVSSTLTALYLCDMDYSAAALQSLADVLIRPTCMLKILNLSGTNIGDDEMISLADALATNQRLEKLYLGPEHTISDIGFAAMTIALCNTSSIGDVHSSNHTLQKLKVGQKPDGLRNYLGMNQRKDKGLVAREKILMHFFEGNFSMEPFHENFMATNILPHLLSWIGRTPDGESFSALFHFLRRIPPLCGNRHPVLKRSGRKRKARN